jgi:folate-binding protein YgfZ
VRGPQATLALNGLVTNDVTALPDGSGQLAVTLTAKGKVITDLLLLRVSSDTLLVATPPAGMEAWLGILRKYVNPRLARATDERATRSAVVVAGRGAAALLAPALSGGDGLHPDALAPWQHGAGTVEPGATVRVVRLPRWGGVAQFLVVTEGDGDEGVRGWLGSRGAVAATSALGELLRVQGGVPRLGADMDEGTIPQEANLDQLGAISFTKGCYTGQETVARVHFRGHVNRQLRHLRPVDPRTVLPVGATLQQGDGREVGRVTSAVLTPTGEALALAMVRREVAPGGTITVTWHAPAGPVQVAAHVEAVIAGPAGTPAEAP